MTHATLMNWEVALDAVGVFCCVLTVLYLIKLKRKAAFKGRISDPTQQKDAGPFKATPIDLPADMSFEGVLASAKNDCHGLLQAGEEELPLIPMMKSDGFWIWEWSRIRLQSG